MRPRALFTPVAPAVAVLVLTPGVPVWAGAGPGGFSSEQPAGTPYKHQGNWEPTVAADPNHPGLVYQLITGINAHQCAPGCPGTSVLFRKSDDGGITWGAEQFVCGLACKGVGLGSRGPCHAGSHRADLTDYGQAVEALRGASAIVHLANIPAPGLTTPAATFNANMTMNFNVFQAAAALGVSRVVWVAAMRTPTGCCASITPAARTSG